MKKKRAFHFAAAMAMIMAMMIGQVSYAATTVKITQKKLESGEQFVFSEMPYNGKYSILKTMKGKTLSFHTVQNFSFTPDGKYVFTVSQCDTAGSSKYHTLLCLCQSPAKMGKDASALCLDAKVLWQYGHGEAISVTQPNKKKEIYNVWVACKPTSDIYGTQIKRMTYQVKNGSLILKKSVVITNFETSNIKNGKATTYYKKPKVTRMNVRVDESSNQIVFRVQSPPGNEIHYVIYDFKKLNAALDKVGNNKTYKIQKAVKWQKANIGCDYLPKEHFQSFDIDGTYLYICGGHLNKGAQIYGLKYKTYANGKAVPITMTKKKYIKKIINLPSKLNVNGTTISSSSLEIESMDIKKNGKKTDFYVSFYNGLSIRNGIEVYKFSN